MTEKQEKKDNVLKIIIIGIAAYFILKEFLPKLGFGFPSYPVQQPQKIALDININVN